MVNWVPAIHAETTGKNLCQQHYPLPPFCKGGELTVPANLAGIGMPQRLVRGDLIAYPLF